MLIAEEGEMAVSKGRQDLDRRRRPESVFSGRGNGLRWRLPSAASPESREQVLLLQDGGSQSCQAQNAAFFRKYSVTPTLLS